MLKQLIISNFILIEEHSLFFESGFTSITGETGAGKSIFVGALSMLLGKKGDATFVRQGANKSVIEGHFSALSDRAIEWLEQKDLLEETETCILRREINISGRSRSFVNDTPVTLSELAELSSLLLDIHSQHENLSLTGASFQLRLVDKLLDKASILTDYVNSYNLYKEAEKHLIDLKASIQKNQEDYDYNLFKYKELREAKLKEGEEDVLTKQELELRYSTDIKQALWLASSSIDNDEGGTIAALKRAEHSLDSIIDNYPLAESFLERLSSCRIELQDIASDLYTKGDSIDSNPQLLEEVSQRLDYLNTLLYKYKVSSVKELLELFAILSEKIEQYDNQDFLLQEANKNYKEARVKLDEKARLLSEERRKTAEQIAQSLTKELHLLELPHAQIRLDIVPTKEPLATGCDEVHLLFSANGKEELRPIGSVASGGEIARVMLSIKALLTEKDDLPTILFDEIDTGISGKVADRMGKILHSMGEKMQVIAITHLPQIAARSKQQIAIEKKYDANEKAHTLLKILSPQEREEEIARLISGDTITNAGLTAAKELLNND